MKKQTIEQVIENSIREEELENLLLKYEYEEKIDKAAREAKDLTDFINKYIEIDNEMDF